MRLINLGTSDLEAAFIADQFCDTDAVSFDAKLRRFSDGGMNYWFFRDNDDSAPPVEFMFNSTGLLEWVSIYVRKDTTVHCPPSSAYVLPPQVANIPKVSLEIWRKTTISVVEEKIILYTWLTSEHLWIMRKGAQPQSCFDTKAGVFVIFDKNHAFSGVAVKYSCNREYLKGILGDIKK